ncbi:hypothetical protein [Pseudomonas sp. KNUC1026]|nr:hypothetical protein [Pseudomonas sp. KNUC1026]
MAIIKALNRHRPQAKKRRGVIPESGEVRSFKLYGRMFSDSARE